MFSKLRSWHAYTYIHQVPHMLTLHAHTCMLHVPHTCMPQVPHMCMLHVPHTCMPHVPHTCMPQVPHTPTQPTASTAKTSHAHRASTSPTFATVSQRLITLFAPNVQSRNARKASLCRARALVPVQRTLPCVWRAVQSRVPRDSTVLCVTGLPTAAPLACPAVSAHAHW
jgi:hypothetical protein